MESIDLARARAHWFRKQGLDGELSGSIPDRLAATGWLRTLAGADAYLAARARAPGMRRADLDAAAEAGDLRVLMAVRSCIYLVPRQHAAVALRFAGGLWRKLTKRDLERVGSSWAEVADLAAAVAAALAGGEALTADELRKALPAGAVRNLGDRGKNVGLSSILPVALREMELRGAVERTLPGGRLDTAEYLWRAPPGGPVAGLDIPDDPVPLHVDLVRIFLDQVGPVSLADIAAWSGLGQREIKAAIKQLPAANITISGYDPAVVLAEDLPALRAAQAPPPETVSFLAFEDNYLAIRGSSLVVDPAHRGRSVESWGSSGSTILGEARHLASRTVLSGDRIAGFWEFDAQAGEIVLAWLDRPSAPVRAAAEAKAQDLSCFLAGEIGHARAHSQDTDADVQARAAALRRA